ncbi:MAG TPA: hypothetical protein VGT41_06975 [Candidatus Babeliales bacterium]|nr:hypothetical protein [Candidatus Babeliales bacterium]
MKMVDENKNNEEGVQQGTITLTYRQASWGMAVLVVLFFFVFITGYFLGKQKEVEDFSNKVERDSLADMISASLYSRYDEKGPSADEGDDVLELLEKVELTEGVESDTADAALATHEQLVASALSSDAEKSMIAPCETKENMVQYYAELVGFGTEKSAMAFVNRLAKENITTIVKAKTSKTAKGKKIVWYQVVTEPFVDHTLLLDLVKKLEKKEHLKGVSIQVYA